MWTGKLGREKLPNSKIAHVQKHARDSVTIVGAIEKAPDIATLRHGLNK
jgi:hypothetical protein